MLGVCLTYTSDRELAQDILHDGFFKVFKKSFSQRFFYLSNLNFMKTKNIIYTLVVILLIAGFYIWGYSTKGGTAGSVQGVSTLNVSKGSLIATEKFYDFGVPPKMERGRRS